VSAPFFTVVIPTRDRRALLLRCLESLGRQDPAAGEFEVVVVDDGSRDGSAEAAQGRPGPAPPRVLRRAEPGGPGAARNDGAAAAHGEFLAFLDDDTVPRPDWLLRARERIDADRLDFLQGACAIEGTGRELLHLGEPEVLSFLGGNMIVRRTLFERLGGFETAFHDPARDLYFREDSDLGFRALDAGARAAAEPRAVVDHPPPFPDFASCVRHVRRYRFDPLLRRRHPARFREVIEVKRVLGLRFRRPHHRAALAHAALLAGAAVALAAGTATAAAVLGGGALAAALAFRSRYRALGPGGLRGIAEAPGFAVLPLLHLAAVLRGCVRYRDFGALL
jgi:glycosyltransferase involved in cell wall biosynthesis